MLRKQVDQVRVRSDAFHLFSFTVENSFFFFFVRPINSKLPR